MRLQSNGVAKVSLPGFIQAKTDHFEGSVEGVPLPILEFHLATLDQPFTEEYQSLVELAPFFLQIDRRVRVEHFAGDVTQCADIERVQELEVEQERYGYVGTVPSEAFPLLFCIECVYTCTDDPPQDSYQTVDSLSELIYGVELLDQEEVELEYHVQKLPVAQHVPVEGWEVNVGAQACDVILGLFIRLELMECEGERVGHQLVYKAYQDGQGTDELVTGLILFPLPMQDFVILIRYVEDDGQVSIPKCVNVSPVFIVRLVDGDHRDVLDQFYQYFDTVLEDLESLRARSEMVFYED